MRVKVFFAYNSSICTLLPCRVHSAQEEAAAFVNGDRVAKADAEAVDQGVCASLEDLQIAAADHAGLLQSVVATHTYG
ncbi:hypothetical protein LDFHOB_08860 [Candidatus Electronema aureum]